METTHQILDTLGQIIEQAVRQALLADRLDLPARPGASETEGLRDGPHGSAVEDVVAGHSHGCAVSARLELLRFRRGVFAEGDSFGFSPGGFAADLISAIEARSLWSRFGF